MSKCLSNKTLFYFFPNSLLAGNKPTILHSPISNILISYSPFSFAAMKKMLSFCLLLALFSACGNNDTDSPSEKPESDMDAARKFIRSALDGNYKQARKLILQDSANVQLLDNLERAYLHNNDVSEQRGYREASIRVHETKQLNDSTSVVVYSNSFKNKKDSVKAVKVGNDWLIDLKYSFPQTRIPQ
jgi:hypothetical protein